MQQNMMSNFQNYKMNMNPNQQMIFNPSKASHDFKRQLIFENIVEADSGKYSDHEVFLRSESIQIKYKRNYDTGVIDDICEVNVVYDHALDVARNFSNNGKSNFTEKKKFNPVILNVIGKEFTGDSMESSEEMRDELINIRTTFSVNPKEHAFPVKDDHCTYTPHVTVIRPKGDPRNSLGWNYCYRVCLISACPISQDDAVKTLSTSHYIKTCTIIENIFQIAIDKGHQVLILTPFGHEDDNNPIEDIIQIYNFCIMKYGHKLKSIFIAIPPYLKNSRELYNEYLKKIIKPNELVKEIDKKYENIYEGMKLNKKMQNNFLTKNNNPDDSDNESPGNKKIPNAQMQNKFQQMFNNMMTQMRNKR